jgi:hypothetical protein
VKCSVESRYFTDEASVYVGKSVNGFVKYNECQGTYNLYCQPD